MQVRAERIELPWALGPTGFEPEASAVSATLANDWWSRRELHPHAPKSRTPPTKSIRARRVGVRMMFAGERTVGGKGNEDAAGASASWAARVACGAFPGAVVGPAGAGLGALGATWRPVRRPSVAE